MMNALFNQLHVAFAGVEAQKTIVVGRPVVRLQAEPGTDEVVGHCGGQWVTVRTRTRESGTGQPGCQKRPFSSACSGAGSDWIDAWNARSTNGNARRFLDLP